MSEGLRILIVEGNPADASFIHEMLPQAGPLHFQVESVRKHSEALTRLEQKDIDLVLLNLILPDSQGLQTFQTLQKAAPEVPVIVLAGYDDHELAIAAVQHGAQDYLVKGQVSVRPLVRAVRYALARQKAAAVVRQSELKFRTLVEAIPQKIFIKGGDYHYLSVNENYARDLHLKPAEVVGMTDYDFFPRELADKYRADDRRIMRNGQTEEFDEKYIQDGREIWIHTAKTPVRNEDGKITGVLGIFWDITERRQAEAKLRESEERYRGLFEHMVEGFAHCRMIFEDGEPKDWIYLSVNQNFEKLTGLKDVVGKRASEVIPGIAEKDPELFKIYARVSLTRKSEQFEMFVQALQQWLAFSVYSPEKESFVVVFDVITGRKIAEEAVRLSREEFKDLFDNAPVGFHEINGEGRLVRINNTELKMMGYSAEELLGQFVWKLSADEELSRRASLAKLAGEIPPPSGGFERMLRRKDGSAFPVWINDQVLKRQDGAIIGMRAGIQDITARKRAEAELNRERDLWRTLLDNSPDKIYFKDSQSRFVKCSKALAIQFGVESPDELVGKTDFDYFDESHARPAYEDEREIIRTGRPMIDNEEREEWKDGCVTWVSSTKVPWLDSAGKIIGIIGISRDITDRKQAELALYESEKRYRQLFDLASDAIVLVDSETHRYMDVNQAAQRLYGYTREEFLRMTPEDVSAEPDKTSEHINLGDAYVPLRWHRKKNGGRFAVEITANQIMYRGRQTALVALRDVTARLQAELALRDSETFLNTVIESIPHMIFVKDAKELRFLKFNKAGRELLGYSLAELAGKNDYDFFPKKLADHFTENDRRVLSGRDVVDIPEESVLTRDKGERIVHTKKIPIFDNTGQLVYLMGISEDITQRKQTEAKVQELQALYHSLVEQMHAGVFRKDAAGRFVFVNPWYCKLKHMPADQILGWTAVEIATRESQNQRAMWRMDLASQGNLHHDQIMQTGQPIELEESYTGPDGQPQFLRLVKSPVFGPEGGIIGTQGIVIDITVQKSAEKRLRQLSSAVEHSPVSIVITDPDGKIEYVNPKFTAVTGYSPGEAIGKTARILKSGDTPPEEYQHLWQLITSGVEWRGEFHNRKKNGEFFWESASISTIFDDSGKIAHFVAVKEDITEVKQAREKLRLRESFLSAITENQPGLLWLKDTKGRFLTVNKAFATACGRSDPEQVRGLTDLDIWPKELAEKYRDEDQWVISSGNPSVVEEMIFVGNKNIWHETFKTAVRDDQGRVIGTTGYARDVSERKRAEQQLTESFNFNRKIISDAPVGIVVFKASGRCVLANENAARTLNATVSQIMEQDFRQIASWRTTGMLALAEEALATKEPRQCESNIVTTFGKEVSLVCHFSPFVQNGEPHLLLVFNDVTEKKRLETQFLRAQRMESIGTLAGGIAHDLNNVLAPLLISVHLLSEKITDAEGRKLIAILEGNIKRGADLVKQVLTFGRGIKGERIMIQIKHVVREIKQMIQETFPKTIQLKMDVAPDVWKIFGDSTQIQQVLLNLCVNARDAMPAGGKLTIRLENTVLDETYAVANFEAKPGRFVVVSVMDTGAGMTREVQDRIFEPFFTTKEHGKGTGLGLSTTLNIVKSHGGFIHCYSEPGKGSTFRVYFPVGDAPDVEAAPAKKPGSLRGHNEMVMVVDDEEPIRNIVKQILERFGYRVLLAANGAEAVEFYAACHDEIAAVITDMAMPVMDGAATIAALKAIKPDAKIIASSGFDPGNKAEDAAKYFIAKPYTAEAVLNILHEVLRADSAK